MGDKSTEEVLLICNKWLSTIGNSKKYQRTLKTIDDPEKPNVEKLEAVKEFAQQRRRVPNALIAWIDGAIDQEKEKPQ